MLFGIGAAASAIDLLKSLTSSKPAISTGKAIGFAASTVGRSSAFSTGVSRAPQSGNLSPGTMSAMIDAQESATQTSSSPADTGRSKAFARNAMPSRSISV